MLLLQAWVVRQFSGLVIILLILSLRHEGLSCIVMSAVLCIGRPNTQGAKQTLANSGMRSGALGSFETMPCSQPAPQRLGT